MISHERLQRRRAASLHRVRKLAGWLDDAVEIPVIGVRVGLDSILGLIPGIGDTAGLLLSGIIIGEAVRVGTPRRLVGRMLGNTGIDYCVGLVPIAGDIFDIYWKANDRNVALLEEWLAAEIEPPED